MMSTTTACFAGLLLLCGVPAMAASGEQAELIRVQAESPAPPAAEKQQKTEMYLEAFPHLFVRMMQSALAHVEEQCGAEFPETKAALAAARARWPYSAIKVETRINGDVFDDGARLRNLASKVMPMAADPEQRRQVCEEFQGVLNFLSSKLQAVQFPRAFFPKGVTTRDPALRARFADAAKREAATNAIALDLEAEYYKQVEAHNKCRLTASNVLDCEKQFPIGREFRKPLEDARVRLRKDTYETDALLVNAHIQEQTATFNPFRPCVIPASNNVAACADEVLKNWKR